MFTLGEGKDGVQVMDSPGEAKYGMTRPQIAQAFRQLRDMGAKTFGIHAFLASNTTSNDYYPELAAILFRLAVELREETGCHIRYINLSGGIGVPYRPGRRKATWVRSSRLMTAPSRWASWYSSARVLLEVNMISLPRKPHFSASISSVRLEQSAPQPSSRRMFSSLGVGVALTAKYSLKPLFQAKAAQRRRALARMPDSS